MPCPRLAYIPFADVDQVDFAKDERGAAAGCSS